MDATKTESADPKTEAGASPPSNGSKLRSETSYPYYGLSRGIEVVSAIRRAGGSEASNADVMRELKVTKLADRMWSYGIPAATQFGLVERIGRGEDGRLRLTELANRIALPANPDEERLAKVAAFKTPELYSTLLERFAGHPVPSKDGLKNLLHRDFKIVESMAPIAADAFFDSLKVAELITSANTISAGENAPPPGKPPSAAAAEVPREVPKPGMQTIQVPENFIVYKCKISGSRVIEIPLPPDFKRADVERLYAFLQTQVDEEPVPRTPAVQDEVRLPPLPGLAVR